MNAELHTKNHIARAGRSPDGTEFITVSRNGNRGDPPTIVTVFDTGEVYVRNTYTDINGRRLKRVITRTEIRLRWADRLNPKTRIALQRLVPWFVVGGLVLLFLAALLAGPAGCSMETMEAIDNAAYEAVAPLSLPSDCRRIGFKEIQRGFNKLYRPSDMHEVVKMLVTVHIVGNRSLFGWKKARAPGSSIQAYANRKNEIWTLGARVKGRIVINQAIYGHEHNHLLQFNHPLVHNPDRLDDIGA